MPEKPTLRGASAEGSVVAIMARSPAHPSKIKTRLAEAVPDKRARVDLYTAFIPALDDVLANSFSLGVASGILT